MDGVSARSKRRWLLRWWAVQGAALYFGLPALLLGEKEPISLHDYLKGVFSSEYFAWAFGTIVVICALQWVYLRPVRPPRTSRKPTSLFWSMLLGGFAVAALLAGLVFAVWGVRHDLFGNRSGVDDAVGWAALGVFAFSWIAATPLLLAFARRAASPEDWLARVAATVFAGSVVDVLAVLPLDALARRREDCWCGRGTLWNVVVGLFAGSILCGPAVFLVLMRRRRRRWPDGRCVACGADVGEEVSVKRCPGCGAGWAD